MCLISATNLSNSDNLHLFDGSLFVLKSSQTVTKKCFQNFHHVRRQKSACNKRTGWSKNIEKINVHAFNKPRTWLQSSQN